MAIPVHWPKEGPPVHSPASLIISLAMDIPARTEYVEVARDKLEQHDLHSMTFPKTTPDKGLESHVGQKSQHSMVSVSAWHCKNTRETIDRRCMLSDNNNKALSMGTARLK